MTGANPTVARMLREVADLLEQQGANPFRVNAYRRAARTADTLGEDIAVLAAREGTEGQYTVVTETHGPLEGRHAPGNPLGVTVRVTG